MSKHFFSDLGVMLGRSMRHITRSMDTIITVCLTPIAVLLLFVYVLGGAIQTGTDNYVNYLLPGVLLMAIASGISYTANRLFTDMQSGIFERFHSMPITRSAALWGACADIPDIQRDFGRRHHSCGARDRLPLPGGSIVMACRGRDPRACDTGTDLDRGDPRADCKIGGRRERFFLPADLPAVHQLGVCADRIDAGARPRLC